MADAVPVSDVLCEATEYLSKLGSNLCVRTENLKDKRIRKDKLQNVHAVRKAAAKVLLICELSKKSIQNVETGIQKILAQLSASQTSEDGGKCKNGESSKSKDSSTYEYFIYDSHKLKIRNKINLKHYMSVNVRATALSEELQEKYPVYHDCKLYRMRKRKEKEKSNSIDNVIDGNQEQNTEPYCNVSTTSEVDPVSKQAITSELESNKNCTDSLLPNSLEKEQDSVNDEANIKNAALVKETTLINDIPENDCISQSRLEKKVPINAVNDLDLKSKDRKHKSKEKSKFKHIKVFNESSESDEEKIKSVSAPNNSAINDTSVQDSNITESVACESSELCAIQNTEKTSDVENIERTIDRSENESNQNKNNEEEHINDNKLEDSSETDNPKKKRKVSSDHKDNDKDSKIEMDNLNKKEANDDKEQSDSSSHKSENSEIKEDTRPRIKCVNINKLLKNSNDTKNKSLLEVSDNANDKHRQKKSSSIIEHSKNVHKINERSDKNKSMKNEDDQFWKEKRRDVKKFVPKHFNISLSRMPKLSEKYLAAHNIVRVTQNGIVVCEHSTTFSSKISVMKSDLDTNKKATDKAICEMDVAKSALLVDSDSDKSDDEMMAKAKQTIDNFLNNQKSDNSDNGKTSNKSKSINKSSSDNNTDKLDANISSHMDKQMTPEPEVEKSKNDIETEIVKSSLMKDSSDENLDKSDNKLRRKSDSITPSKRKHIMESMHAKKMLLTYSSSSDTEDEQLRNALKEIRNSLLQESVEDSKKNNEVGVSEEKSKNNENQSELEGSEIDIEKTKKSNNKKTSKSNKSETEQNNESESSAKSSKRRAKGSTEENSNSCSKKVRRK